MDPRQGEQRGGKRWFGDDPRGINKYGFDTGQSGSETQGLGDSLQTKRSLKKKKPGRGSDKEKKKKKKRGGWWKKGIREGSKGLGAERGGDGLGAAWADRGQRQR